MYFAFIAAFFALILGVAVQTNSVHTQQLYDNAYTVDTGINFGVYANKALAAYTANPSLTGVIPVATLNLPAWYQPMSGLTAFVGGSHLFVFQAQPNAATAGRVLKQVITNGSVVAGICNGGTIYSSGNLALMAAPIGVPNNAVVQIIL